MIDKPLDVQYIILGLPIRIRTINLAQPWKEIHKTLYRLVELRQAEFESQ